MKLLTAPDQDTIINLAMVQSVQLDHLSASSLIIFIFSDKQNVVWRFTKPERANEVFESICTCSSYTF